MALLWFLFVFTASSLFLVLNSFSNVPIPISICDVRFNDFFAISFGGNGLVLKTPRKTVPNQAHLIHFMAIWAYQRHQLWLGRMKQIWSFTICRVRSSLPRRRPGARALGAIRSAESSPRMDRLKISYQAKSSWGVQLKLLISKAGLELESKPHELME